ncbi:DNA ligase (ATP) [Diaporthe australafricana]|uniref:DNA ligase n=1 Tax=Diaporthe australafricana TaxID=127596 RepID=A0ABR3XHF8_9PEZI
MSQHANPDPSPTESVQDEEERMYAHDIQGLDLINQQYPHRPRNHGHTLLFGELVKSVFEPLKNGPPSIAPAARLRGRKQITQTAHKHIVLDKFFSHWRTEVGNDVYPAMRLICPDDDRDRPKYRLKEQALGKLLIGIMNISKTSKDAMGIMNWKNPGSTAATRMAGDFAGRCFEALKPRAYRRDYGDVRIAEVNGLLDKLAAVSKEAEQQPILQESYRRMCPEELQWLIRIILTQMRIGGTGQTVMNIWHPDSKAMFATCTSMREVCWELWDPTSRLDEDRKKLTLMSTFQPQLAPTSNMALTWDKIVQKLGVTEEEPEFWMEEKLDGERMQMHVDRNDNGEMRFGFWSRKGKNYTYLYGDSLDDDNSALTRFLGDGFQNGVVNCILDGEMIGFDPRKGEMVTFGTLKSAAIHTRDHPYDERSARPLFRIFDLLYFFDEDITAWPLRERRKMLEGIIKGVPGRFEVHPRQICTSPSEIEPYLRKIIQSSSEGIMLKNPKSPYVLNDRSWFWAKVKPDYMDEFGENLDCVIIGGYYGTGRRGGILSSFLCGLRASKHDIENGTAGPEKFFSFFKVGGGFKAEDYTEIQRLIPEDKWHDWNPKSARQYIELAGEERYFERPDRWVRPSESIVIEVKAASVEDSISFSVRKTLRFPRFRGIRNDKSWTDALDIDEWNELRYKAKEMEEEKREIQIEKKRKKASSNKRQKRGLTIPGSTDAVTIEKSKLFEGMSFYVPGRSQDLKKTTEELENLVRENGGSTVQNPARVAEGNAIALADRQNMLVLSLLRMEGVKFVVSPKWVLDCINQEYLLPYEDNHLYLAPDDMRALAVDNADQYGDSYYRDLDAGEMARLFALMKENRTSAGEEFDKNAFYDQLEARGHELPRSRGYLFRRRRVYLAQVEGKASALTTARLESWVRFGSGELADDLDDGIVTHVVVVSRGDDAGARKVADEIRTRVSQRESLKRPYVVTEKWMEKCWEEETLVAEEPYFV